MKRNCRRKPILSGAFRRFDSRFRDQVTADGSSPFKAEAGRYHLYVAYWPGER